MRSEAKPEYVIIGDLAFRLRPLATPDAERLAELEKVLFPGDNPWSARDFRSEFAAPHSFYIGVEACPVDVIDAESAAVAERRGDAPDGKGAAELLPVGADKYLVGYAGLAKLGPQDSPEFEIHTIGVDPRFQRRGLARLLMDNLMFVADTYRGPVFLEVRTDNVPAIAMYETYGFQRMGVRKRYYQPSGADAYTMIRPAVADTAAPADTTSAGNNENEEGK